MAEEVTIPLNVLLAFGLGLTLGVLLMFIFGPPQPTVLGGFAGLPRVQIERDATGRLVSVSGGG